LSTDWFSSWFDSPYYHILYKNRDDDEAKIFIQNLADRFGINSSHHVLDLACGKGRHSIFLNSLGVNVLGVDLSNNSIEYAKQFAADTLKFAVHDMREPFAKAEFDFVLNLFTSFGYFETETDNLKTIASIAQSLKEDGVFIIDFFNATKVLKQLIPYQLKQIEGINFYIIKRIDGNHILKQIDFEDRGKAYSFTEKVQFFHLNDFKLLFEEAGLRIIASYGNYNLESYDEESSNRLILAASRI